MILHLFDAAEEILTQPFRPNSSVVAFDICILLWLVWLNVDQADPCFGNPCLKPPTDLFGAVVHANGQRFPAPSNDLVQGPDNALRR